MSSGRTYWYSEDASYVQRGRIVALGEEFGPAVLAVMMVLRGEAKQQHDGGCVLSAISTVARNGFVGDRELVRRVIERAGELGELDDLEWLDGLRFRCRISGWTADQERAAGARRVAKHRSSNGAVTPCNEDRDRTENDSLRSSSRRENDHDGDDAGTAAPDRPTHQPEPAAPLDATADQAPLCHLLAGLIVENGGRRPRIGRKWKDAERLLLERDRRDRSEAERLIAWCQADEFWRSNILSMGKFREQYDRLRLQSQRSNGSAGGAARRESASELLQALDSAAAARRQSPEPLALGGAG